MTIEYSLVTEEVAGEEITKVRMTSTIPEKVEVKELGNKEGVLSTLTADKAKYQGTIDSYTAMIVEVQAKIDAINAL